MGKHFILNPTPVFSSKEDVDKREINKQASLKSQYDVSRDNVKKVLQEQDDLKHREGRVIVKIDLNSKNEHTFKNGHTISRERNFNDFNRRNTQPVNCIVISSDTIPQGTEIIVEHNATHDMYRIFNYKDKSPDVKYYSVPIDQCYLYLDGNTWKSIPPYQTALQVFKPYEGHLIGMPPIPVKDTLYVTSGEYSGKVVKTLIGCNYVVVFQDTNGREGNIIRFLPNGDPKTFKESEAIAILNDYTEKVNSGKYLVGNDIRDAKPLNEYYE